METTAVQWPTVSSIEIAQLAGMDHDSLLADILAVHEGLDLHLQLMGASSSLCEEGAIAMSLKSLIFFMTLAHYPVPLKDHIVSRLAERCGMTLPNDFMTSLTAAVVSEIRSYRDTWGNQSLH